VSYDGACGIRGYAQILEAHLRQRDCSVESLWWERDDHGGLSSRTLRGFRDWGRAVRNRVHGGTADVVVWHYSVFGYGCRGVPVFAAAAARRLSRSKVPVVVVLHEFGHPWWWPGWRGRVFATTHRVALCVVMRSASRAVVTTEERQNWMQRRWWLPSIPVAFEPVFSTLEPGAGPEATSADGIAEATIGVFGYGAARMRPDIATAALAILAARGRRVTLRLVGAPGRDSAAGRRWQLAARNAGLSTALTFTGPLEPDDLSRALCSLDVVVFPDEAGPTSRKTTLAALLHHGCCVVAIDGDATWHELVDEGAVVVASPDPAGLASELETLLADEDARRAQGRRAADFYDGRMSSALVVGRMLPLLFPPEPAEVNGS
jgi:glycosyltransferase involved in cell wall biosynthesis